MSRGLTSGRAARDLEIADVIGRTTRPASRETCLTH
jgi:hypothetical protein